MRRWNRRQWMAALMVFSLLLLILVTAAGLSFEEAAGVTDFSRRKPPARSIPSAPISWAGTCSEGR